MRTLQEKYNAIQEGKFSKEHFIVEARMQHPQIITRFNGYDDAVQILKNRGMISDVKIEEARLTEAKGHSFTFNYNTDPDDVEYIQRVLDNAGADAIAKAGTFDDEMIVRAFDAIGLRKARKAIEADGFEINENVNEARLTKNNLTDYRFKPTNEMDKYPYEQILRGLRVELETMGIPGTPTAEEYAKALAKVSKNLAKDSIFYTNQLAGVNPKVDLHDKMVDATAKNTVDTFNGMKKATLKEGIKNLIKKVLSEEVIDVESYKEDEVYEMYGEDSVEESAMGDVYLLAQESDSFEQFVQAVEAEHGPVEDIAELEHIFNSTRGEDDIDFGDENFSDPFIDGDLEENKYEEADKETDRKFILRLMDMYEADPSKYEKLHKEAEVMARTEKDIKYKHVLSLIVRAKAGALQRLSDQDKRQADSEGMFESVSLKDLL